MLWLQYEELAEGKRNGGSGSGERIDGLIMFVFNI